MSGIGVVIKDCNDFFVSGMCQYTKNSMATVRVDVMAALFGLKFAMKLGYKRVILEGDSKIVMDLSLILLMLAYLWSRSNFIYLICQNSFWGGHIILENNAVDFLAKYAL